MKYDVKKQAIKMNGTSLSECVIVDSEWPQIKETPRNSWKSAESK